ncbi:P22 phage major capsid protein family protein [Psychrobacter sanguinis]|uniref:P22 phage major capsid protein family protein n=1 Tax=Psychrobacter sanguinis TaxID=861445 RepID=UPI002A75E1EE|nr:P22 phage major capsid protein family protein [Psychrobacter sanguinis]MDY3306529.1 P22 phage major capsid protein family protein [Psychrobacter sanguinis]
MAGSTKNQLLKQELVMFDEVIADFEETLVYTQMAERFNIGDAAVSARANDTVWRPMPLQVDSQEGLDQTGNFLGHTELAVPVTVDRVRSVPGTINSRELRDPSVLRRKGNAAKQKLASDVNDALRRQVAYYGSIVDTRAGAATGFDDAASLMAKFDDLGVPENDRMAIYSSRDMVKMASDLASRQTLSGKTQTAYEKAYINEIAGFDVHKDASGIYLPAATATGATVSGANQRHIPTATKKNPATGDEHNVDNRSMKLTVAATGGAFAVGDAFTIAGVYAVNMKNKQQTQELKTFRVIGVDSATQIEIVPAIVCDDGPNPTGAEEAYKNVSATPAAGAAITMLNKKASYANSAFVKGALEFIPSTLALDGQDGWATTKATLDNGLTVYYTRQGDINDLSTKYRWDIVFGTALLNPEMAGIQLFNQGA